VSERKLHLSQIDVADYSGGRQVFSAADFLVGPALSHQTWRATLAAPVPPTGPKQFQAGRLLSTPGAGVVIWVNIEFGFLISLCFDGIFPSSWYSRSVW
jgi:hypothetical protein